MRWPEELMKPLPDVAALELEPVPPGHWWKAIKRDRRQIERGWLCAHGATSTVECMRDWMLKRGLILRTRPVDSTGTGSLAKLPFKSFLELIQQRYRIECHDDFEGLIFDLMKMGQVEAGWEVTAPGEQATKWLQGWPSIKLYGLKGDRFGLSPWPIYMHWQYFNQLKEWTTGFYENAKQKRTARTYSRNRRYLDKFCNRADWLPGARISD